MKPTFWQRIQCLIGVHHFAEWFCQSDEKRGFDAQFWFERRCKFCPAKERKDFR